MPKLLAAPVRNPLSASTRERIMSASETLIRQMGYEVSMEAIAADADVSKQTLYNQFGSKEELFKSIISNRAVAMRAPLEASSWERDPREVLFEVARQYYALAFNIPALGFLRTIVAAGRMDGARRASWTIEFRQPKTGCRAFSVPYLGHIQMRGLMGIEETLSPDDLD